MIVLFEKQPLKYLEKVDEKTKQKLLCGVEDIKELRGDIKRLNGGNYSNMYRYKISHYRIIFKLNKDNEIIIINTINTRTNIKY